MTLVALDGTPLVAIGAANRAGIVGAVSSGIVLVDAANEAAIMFGQIFTEDLGTHTIDTTGSSSLGWRTSPTTFANAATRVKVGLAALDTSTGPPARAVHVANVITFDVSKTLAGGGGGITASAWQEHVPDAGTKTIAHGEVVAFCVQMTVLGGADSIQVAVGTAPSPALIRPGVTGYTGGSYADAARIPNAVITFSDGVRGYFYGGYVQSVFTTGGGSNTDVIREYGNYMALPFPVRVYGIVGNIGPNSGLANFDLILYSNPLVTPVAEKTASMNAHIFAGAVVGPETALFATPYDATASQPLVVASKPTTTTNITVTYKSFNIAAHQNADFPGSAYACTRGSSGAFTQQNSGKDRYGLGLLIGAFDAGGGSVAGLPASRLQLGH